ncbi:ABC transporter ATP-binding protein [Galbibacter sp. PAP.153]|uniref:ABC transporter ATP-binding protein n=1 Tax=Galbibacter sp. PAP.153 TaxID=3104623 RepID=UPI00300AB2B2
MNYFRQILRFAKPYRKYGYLNIFFNVMYALFSALSLIALFPMLNVLFKTVPPIKAAPEFTGDLKAFILDSVNYKLNTYIESNGSDGEMKALLFSCLLIIGLFLLKNVSNYLAMFFITFYRNGVLKDLRNALYKKILSLPIGYFSDQKKGDTMARASNDIQEVQWTFLSILELIVREPLTIIFTLIAMIVISPKLTLFVFLFLPIMGFFISYIGKKLKKHSDRAQKEQGNVLSIIEETLGGLKVIKGFNAENRFFKTFTNATDRLNKYMNSVLNRQNIASPMSEFLGIIAVSGVLWFGGIMVLQEKSLDSGLFIAFLASAYNILTPAKQISKALSGVKRGDAAAERIIDILDAENSIQDAPNAIEKTSFDKNISIGNVSFKYEDELVLKDFTLNIDKGKTVALVGQSGSGKSTIANLITRFYDVNDGTIEIDGIDIKEISIKSLRSLMGIVTQDSILFNDTVANNIRIGKPDATMEEIEKAAKIANAHEFIKNLPNGFDTNIGDAGGKLSGGQKQRLSIARAVLKNPPIMILDEATSALDTESEKLVQTALENMMKNRTSVVIAHRLSTIQNADSIAVMQKGQIVEQGTHQELLNKKGVYQKLVEMQSFD